MIRRALPGSSSVQPRRRNAASCEYEFDAILSPRAEKFAAAVVVVVVVVELDGQTELREGGGKRERDRGSFEALSLCELA